MIHKINMRKIILVFVSAWLVYCLIQTGYAVTDPKWREYLKQDPNAVQDLAGDVFNQGARLASKEASIATEKEVTFIAEFDSLKALSFGYWLYPTHFNPSRATSIKNAFANPDTRAVFFIGSQKSYEASLPYLNPAYNASVMRVLDGNVFVVLRRT